MGRLSGAKGARWVLTGLAAGLSGVAWGVVPARASAPEGCTLASSTSSVESCSFVAHARDEIGVAGSANWWVTVTRGHDIRGYGRGHEDSCFLDGALYTGRRLAVCSGAVVPGDQVQARISGPGVLVIGNLVCDHDPLCSPE